MGGRERERERERERVHDHDVIVVPFTIAKIQNNPGG
jgi:hypothetical protein